MSGPIARYNRLSAGWQEDGHPHIRDDDGFCGTCGATENEPHYRCVTKEEA